MARRSNASLSNRTQYKNLWDDLKAINENAVGLDRVREATKVASSVDKLLKSCSIEERVQWTGSTIYHSRILKDSSSILLGHTKELKVGLNSYNSDEFAELIKNDHSLWEETVIPMRIPDYKTLNGAVPTAAESPTKLAKKSRTVIEKQQLQERKTTEKVDEVNKSQERLQTSKVHKILKKLYKKNNSVPISYFHFALHPTSFSKSIETIYHLSFLVRDGLVELILDKEGLPFIIPLAREENEDGGAAKVNNQFVLSLDMEEWEKAIEKFNITRPIKGL